MTWNEFSKEIDIGMLLIVGLIGCIILTVWVKKFKQQKLEEAKSILYGYNETGNLIVECGVKLIEKSSHQHNIQADWAITVNYCTFELINGERIRFAIETQHIYDTLVQGDVGTLEYVGKKFVNFAL